MIPLPRDPQADDAPAILANVGYQLLRRNRYDEALAAFQSAARLRPEDPAIQIGLGLAAFELQDFPRAVAAFQTAARVDAQNLESRVNLAIALDRAGNTAEATTLWRELEGQVQDATLREQIRAMLAVRS